MADYVRLNIKSLFKFSESLVFTSTRGQQPFFHLIQSQVQQQDIRETLKEI